MRPGEIPHGPIPRRRAPSSQWLLGEELVSSRDELPQIMLNHLKWLILNTGMYEQH